MKAQRIISIGSTLTAVAFLTLWINERAHQFTPEPEKAPIRELLRHVRDIERQHADRSNDLREKLHQTQALLNEIGIELREKEKQIKDLRFGQQAHNFISDIEAMLMAGISGPTNAFARVISPTGKVHFEDAEFSSEAGGRLFFRTPKNRKGLYVTEIHPVIIRALDRDPLALVNSMKSDRLRRLQMQRETKEKIRESSVKSQQIMWEKKQEGQRLEQERVQQQLEREERMRQYELAQQELLERQRRAREAERLREQQLLLDQRSLDVEAYRLYLYQQQQQRLRGPIGLPAVPVRSLQTSSL